MENRILKSKIIEHFGTQSDFAVAIGSSDPAVSRVVRSRRELTDDEKAQWARVLKSKSGELFGAATTT